jgi:hypothetical protein
MQDTVKAGIKIGLLLHLLQIPFHYGGGADWKTVAQFVWVTQLLYMLPSIMVALVCRKIRVSQGMLIVAGLTFLFSVATCGALGL